MLETRMGWLYYQAPSIALVVSAFKVSGKKGVLQALQEIGEGSALLLVAEMAAGSGKAAGQPEIEHAAQQCLPFLNLRAENQRLNRTLLRASDGNVTPAEMLLRPA